MSYVSLENSEPFLKCFEVIAEDKSCIVTDSVLYFSGKTGKGFITVAGIAAGIEVLAVNVSMPDGRSWSSTFYLLPSSSSYILSFDEIEIPGKLENDCLSLTHRLPSRTLSSVIHHRCGVMARVVTYPRDRVIRSLVVQGQKSALERLIRILMPARLIHPAVSGAGAYAKLADHVQVPAIINDFMAEIVQHPFRELFTIRNISILVEYLLQQFL